jgi:hypothetical protein
MVGSWGRRNGTQYANTPRAAWGIIQQPWFRFRNDECERICREAWAQPAPTKGELFIVAEDQSWSGQTGRMVETASPLKQCSLVIWEGEALQLGQRRFREYNDGEYNDGEYYRWYTSNDGVRWYPAGRLLQLNPVMEVQILSTPK